MSLVPTDCTVVVSMSLLGVGLIEDVITVDFMEESDVGSGEYLDTTTDVLLAGSDRVTDGTTVIVDCIGVTSDCNDATLGVGCTVVSLGLTVDANSVDELIKLPNVGATMNDVDSTDTVSLATTDDERCTLTDDVGGAICVTVVTRIAVDGE